MTTGPPGPLRVLLTAYAQQATRDVLHCAQDVWQELSGDPTTAEHMENHAVRWRDPAAQAVQALLAVDVIVRSEWPAGRWELVSDGQTVAVCMAAGAAAVLIGQP